MTVNDSLLARTFVDVADTLVDDFDVVDFLTVLTSRCLELFELSEAGLLLADPPRGLRVAASSSNEMRVLQLFEVQHDDGPSLECYRTGAAVHCPDLRTQTQRWPRFAPEALASGYASVDALPMHLRDEVIGSLMLLRATPGPFPAADLVAAQALADVATIEHPATPRRGRAPAPRRAAPVRAQQPGGGGASQRSRRRVLRRRHGPGVRRVATVRAGPQRASRRRRARRRRAAAPSQPDQALTRRSPDEIGDGSAELSPWQSRGSRRVLAPDATRARLSRRRRRVGAVRSAGR